MTKTDLAAIVDVSIDFMEDWSSGSCAYPDDGGPKPHDSKCPTQGVGDAYCDCIADAANLCARAHDDAWWDFTACMFANNGSPWSASGLENDSTFKTTVRMCANQSLTDYTFDELESCYTGSEGSDLAKSSAQRFDAAGMTEGTWLYVAGELVAAPSKTSSMDDWAEAVKAKVCSLYEGTKPDSCTSSLQV